MEELSIFDGISKENIECMLKCFNAKKMSFKKDSTIVTNLNQTKMIAIMLSGTASMVRYDYNGSKTLLENLERDSVFGEIFSYLNNEIYVTATSDCEVLFIDYEHIIKRCKNACEHHSRLTDNVLHMLSEKIITLNERLEVLSKRTTREKLLCYFNLLAKNKVNRTFKLPFTYTDLADYLSVDRTAMTRELSLLKEEGFIKTVGRKITLNF